MKALLLFLVAAGSTALGCGSNNGSVPGASSSGMGSGGAPGGPTDRSDGGAGGGAGTPDASAGAADSGPSPVTPPPTAPVATPEPPAATPPATAPEPPVATPPASPVAPPATPPSTVAPAAPPPSAVAPAPPAQVAAGPTCGGCAQWGEPVAHGALPSQINELSGLAASRRHPGLYYTHNDSGDVPRLFAIDENGKLSSELRLTGAAAWDWEDVAVGPCPAGTCVYVADTGDGTATRDFYTIYRLPEPATMASGTTAFTNFDRFDFLYPDGTGRHNSEALMVHPTNGRLFVIIKMGGRPSIYEMPQPLMPGKRVTLVQVGTLALPASDSIVTGATFHPCENRMLVRTTAGLYEFTAPGGSVESLLAATPTKVPVAAQEPQGEAVSYTLDGRRYLTSSETGTPPQPMNIVSCQRPSP